MKKIISTCIALMVSAACSISAFAMEVPTNTTIQDLNGVRQYIKIYTVAPDTDPQSLIDDVFEYDGYTYTYSSMTKEEQSYSEKEHHTETVTADTEKSDLSVVLKALSPSIEYDDGEFQGTLYLDHSTISTVASGYTTKSYTVSATKEIDNLDTNDMAYVPDTTTKNGVTVQLQSVDWQVQGTSLVDDIITRIGLNPAITGDSLGRGFPGTLTYLVMRSATSHITKAIGKSTGKGNRGAASGSTTGGPRIGGGPSGAHNAAGHTASYQAYQATQQQNTSQGVDGQGFVSQRESVQSGGAQTATQEHFSNSSMQNTSSIRQTAFRGAEARKSSVPSGMRREPAYVTSANRDSPSSAQTPAAGHDTSGNKTTSTVREQSNVTASIRTANSAQHSLSGNASQHEPAGRSPAPMSTRMTQANMQGVRSKVNDRSAQRPEQTENAAAQSIDHAVPAVAQRPSPGSAGISSSPAVSGQHSSQPFGMGTRYTQRPSARGVSEQKPKAIRPGHAGTSPTQPAPSSTVESARSSSGRAAHPASSTQGPIAGSRPDRNIPQGSNVPPNQTRKTNNNPARQEARPIGIRNEPSAKGMFSAQRPDPAGNRADVSQGTLTRPTTGNRAVASKNVLMPSTLIKGSVKNSKEISSSSRKQRREKHERK